MNGLQALDYLLDKQDKLEKYGTSGTISVSKQRECLNAIEKELKALEIIKRKSTLDFGYIRNADNYDEYLKHFGEVIQELLKSGESIHFAVTKDEFDLLKEVLK